MDSRRRPLAVLLPTAVLLGAGLAGCGSSGIGEAAPTATVTVTAPAPAPATPAAPSSGPAPSQEGTGAAALALGPGDFVDVSPADGVDLDVLASPSGNLYCLMSSGEEDAAGGSVSCTASEAGWAVPEEPGCEQDWVATEISLSEQVTTGQCRGDTYADPGAVVLAYGEGWTAGAVSCASREDGITCSDARTGHGFRISRDSYLVF